MSEMLDDIFTKSFMHLALDEGLLSTQAKAPGRLNRSASFFAPPSSSASAGLSMSTEHVNGGDGGSPFWPSNIWSHGPMSKSKPLPFKPDRSMSLTESPSSLLAFEQLKNMEAFGPGPSTTVAPPPGFAPSSVLPAQVQPMVSPNRYKTELCRGYQETGSCKYGSKCQFAHGEAELRGLYRHPKYKTEPCRTFYNFGYCPYGSRCHFIHEDKVSGGPSPSAKFQNHPSSAVARPLPGRSVSFAGFQGPRSSPPPSFPSFNDPNLAFSRAPSVSPPPADLLSPVFGDVLPRESVAFQFGSCQTRASTGDIHSIPLILEPKAARCGFGHGNTGRAFCSAEDGTGLHHDNSKLFPGPGGHAGLPKPAGLQRFSSEDSLEDSYSSSGGSSGSESPTFDGSATKRLTVFERLSLSD